ATCHNCGRPSHRAKDCKKKSTPVCYECEEKGHTRNYCPEKNNPQGEQARGRAYVIKEADKDQFVMGTFLLNSRHATVLFDSGSDKSFVNTSFSHLIDIDPARLNTSYEVELADGRVASTNIVLKGCWLNTRDTNLFVTIVRNITMAIAGQLATTAEGRAIVRKTVRRSQLQSVMNVEKRVTPETIVQKRITLKVNRLVDELM
nr:hypothetical protein [Tanacetum cinerariifolium]